MYQSVGKISLLMFIALACSFPCTAQSTTTRQMAESNNYTIEPVKPAPADKQTSSVRIVASNLPLSRVAAQIEDQTGIPIRLKGTAGSTKVTLIKPNSTPLDEALASLTSTSPNLIIRLGKETSDKSDKQGYEIWTKDDYEKQNRVVRLYQLNQAAPLQVRNFVRPLLNPGSGAVDIDPRMNKLLVIDTPEKQKEIEDLISKVDKPIPTRVFYVNNRKATDLARYLIQRFELSARNLIADDPTGQIIISAPQNTLTEADRLIEILDIVPASKTRPTTE